MPNRQKHETEGFNEFLRNYETAKPLEKDKPINTSKFTLDQQLKRFSGFFHDDAESETVRKEINAL